MLAPQTEEAYRRLRRMILSLELRPGEGLVERKLEEILSVSRTPIRAAIQQLSREGLVHRTGRVYSVAPIEPAELEEAFDFRRLLETTAVRLVAARDLPKPDLKALEDTADIHFDPEAPLDTSRDFHVVLARLSGNRFLVEALVGVLDRIYRARYLEALSSLDQAHTDHRHLVDLIRQGRADEAVVFLEAHLERSREGLLSSLEHTRLGHILLGK